MGSFSGSTIADSSTIKSALQALETSLETKGAASDLSGVISNTGDLVTLSGVAAGSVNLGVFDGDTLSDNATLKVVLQDAEDAIEANASAISSEASSRAAAITALTNGAVADNTAAINQEVTDRAAAITALTNGAVADNAAGIVTNAAAITSLTNGAVANNAAAIAQEVTDRQAAVSAEATARADADALLMPKAGGTFTGAISGPAPTADGHLATKKYADDLVANVDLSQVETNRVNIAAETSARTSADTALSGRLDVLEADPTTATALQAEASTRASADTALSNRVTSLEADPTTQTLLNAETTARTSADTALSGRLDVLEADPTTQTLLDAETAARIAGDNLLLSLTGGALTGDLNVGAGAASGGVWNSSYLKGSPTLSNDDQTFTASDIKEGALASFTIPLTGKYYWEIELSGDLDTGAGFFPDGESLVNSSYVGQQPGFYGFRAGQHYQGSAQIYTNSAYTAVDTNNVLNQSTSTTIGFTVDRDTGEIDFYRGGDKNERSTILPANYELFGVILGNYAPAGSSVTLVTSASDWTYPAPAGFEALPETPGSGSATTIGVDGTASFGGAVVVNGVISSAAVPTEDVHLVNKLYADNLVAGVDLSGIATNAAAIEALTNGAPELLNTLAELGDAIGDDANFATTITNQITNESTTRASADTALSGRLDVLEADPTTASALTTESNARASADTSLSNRLDTLEADPTTQTLLTAETTARTAADSALSGRLDTLEADPTTQTLLTAEATTRAAADTALSGRLDTLEADPTTATAVTSAIAVETAARTAADTAEANARAAADALLLPLAGGSMSGNIIFGGAGTSELVNVDFTDAADASVFTAFEGSEHPVTTTDGGYAFLKNNGSSASSYITLATEIGTEYTLTTEVTLWNGAWFRVWIEHYAQPMNSNDAIVSDHLNGNQTYSTTFTATSTSTVVWYQLPGATDNMKVHSVLVQGAGVSTNAAVNVDGTASFAGNITASAVPTADAHLVNKLYADQLVANVDLSQVETNRLAIIQEISDRAAAITALTSGQVATNTSGIATNATAITNLTNGAVADNAAAIAALTNGAVADNAAAIAQETTDRIAADALKVDKQSLVNAHMLGQTSAQSTPVDAQGNDNYLFLVVDKATGALKSIDKTFLEAE